MYETSVYDSKSGCAYEMLLYYRQGRKDEDVVDKGEDDWGKSEAYKRQDSMTPQLGIDACWVRWKVFSGV